MEIMADETPRQALERLAQARGDDWSALSRLIGRNPAYVQQFIRRGTPKRLAEEDRRVLAEYFGVAESVLGAPARKAAALPIDFGGDLMAVARYAVGASAGAGALAADEAARAPIAFPTRWLRDLAGDPARLSIIAVEGDSMEPTLSDGDEILVDRGDGAERLRDGIYVLRQDEALIVKRIAMNPARPSASRRFTIRSDNVGYPDWPDCGSEDVSVIGRVVWAGRRIA